MINSSASVRLPKLKHSKVYSLLGPAARKCNREAQEGEEAVHRGGLDQEAIGFRSV